MFGGENTQPILGGARTQLILDAAGVIVSNLSPGFWREISRISEIPYGQWTAFFKKEIRDDLWTGATGEDDFLHWMNRRAPGITMDDLRDLIRKYVKPLPAFKEIPAWSRLADIHLLSNHRKEWVTPHIEPIIPYLKSVTISSAVGYCKPDPRIYKLVHDRLDPSQKIVYVDDQLKNVKPASNLGWITVVADDEGKWIGEVTTFLETNETTG